MTDPHEMFEAFAAEAIAKSPEPLQELGKFLSERLDEDDWKTADRLLLQLATLQSSSEVQPMATSEALSPEEANDWLEWTRLEGGAASIDEIKSAHDIIRRTLGDRHDD